MKYIATGRVHPERADIKFSRIPLNLGSDGKLTISCDASQLTVILEFPTEIDLATVRNTAEHFSQMIVSSLGYSLGTGYSVEVIQVVPEKGDPAVFGVRPGKLEFEPYGEVFVKALNLAGAEPLFRLALRDYTRALVDTTDCAFYCYRAVEAIKSSFQAGSDSKCWESMHDALGTRQETIEKSIKYFADTIRHGNWKEVKPTNSKQRHEMLKLTRDILYKYIQFKGY